VRMKFLRSTGAPDACVYRILGRREVGFDAASVAGFDSKERGNKKQHSDITGPSIEPGRLLSRSRRYHSAGRARGEERNGRATSNLHWCVQGSPWERRTSTRGSGDVAGAWSRGTVTDEEKWPGPFPNRTRPRGAFAPWPKQSIGWPSVAAADGWVSRKARRTLCGSVVDLMAASAARYLSARVVGSPRRGSGRSCSARHVARLGGPPLPSTEVLVAPTHPPAARVRTGHDRAANQEGSSRRQNRTSILMSTSS